MCLYFSRAVRKMSVNRIRYFIFKNYYKRIEFSNQNSYYSIKRLKKKLFQLVNKLIEKIPVPCNSKGHYQSFIRKKTKSVKQSETITHQGFGNSNTADI